ncbi:MAG: aminoacyltransferase [Candidatus Peregrinibacteria bacterium]|nr:aminoacyltransferase [Candidatus Peregrinibacteria bacterium]
MEAWKKYHYRNLWQHPLWAEMQKQNGREVWHFKKKEDAEALVIKHQLPFGLCWLEVPRGPLFLDEASLQVIMEELAKLGRKEGAVFVRLSSYAELGVGSLELGVAKGDHHPETSLVIDLDQSEDAILAHMKPKGRYNIRVAEKHHIKVEPSEDLDSFYRILKDTGGRDGFGIHLKSYYENMLKALGKHAQLLLARYEDRVVAGGIFVYLDEWGIYYYGASDHHYRNMMAPYLVQWHAIQEAKKRGCKHYDFLGIAPEGASGHAWAGVTEFKKKFGGRVVSYPVAKDLVLRPFWYFLYKLRK